MNLLRLSNQQTKYLAMAAIFALSAIVALLAPLYASADALNNRSIGLSNATVDATDVTYNVQFNATQAAGAYVVDFCSDSPVIGDTCVAPVGLDASSAAPSAADTGTTIAAQTASTLTVTQAMTAGEDVNVEFEGLTNPDAAGPMYARIVTFDNATSAEGYSATTAENAGALDWGGIALSITNDINVTGRVLESMIFCVASAEIHENCSNASANAPVLKLGEGDPKALNASAVSTGSLYTQISTNAAGGAVVSLKSDALNCGGLLRLGAPTACDIAPALDTDIGAGEAKFGVKTSTATATALQDDGETAYTGAAGTLQAYPSSGYNASTYAFNYTSGNADGVTSVYGDPFLNTADAPVNNMNMELTFGASVANNTPAGDYSTHLSLIATGKF